MDSPSRHWIVTGATGFIGRELVRRVLLHSKDRLTVLVRDSDGGNTAAQRTESMLDSLGIRHRHIRSRVSAVSADITASGLGISDDQRRRLTRSKRSIVVHLAAGTSFSAPLDVARRTNVEGTRQALALARELHNNGNLDTFAHISTAFVAADRTDIVDPGELDMAAGFRNSYERSKAEAELIVRTAMAEIPTVIFRPSIVVGNSITGDADGGNTIYWGLKQYLRGYHYFFAKSDATLDIVPVDYVVDAMLALLNHRDRHGKCFPLVAGPEKQITLGEFAARASAYFQRRPPRYLPPRILHLCTRPVGPFSLVELVRAPKKRRFIENMLSYLPYFSANPAFDNTITTVALAPSGIEAPRLQSYLPVLLEYCVREGWTQPLPAARDRAPLASFYTALSRIIKRPIVGPTSA